MKQTCIGECVCVSFFSALDNLTNRLVSSTVPIALRMDVSQSFLWLSLTDKRQMFERNLANSMYFLQYGTF